MLVLSRKRDETIVLDFSEMSDAQLLALRGARVEVGVVDIRGDKVRLGTHAPREVGVHRREVFLARLRDKELAAAKK